MKRLLAGIVLGVGAAFLVGFAPGKAKMPFMGDPYYQVCAGIKDKNGYDTMQVQWVTEWKFSKRHGGFLVKQEFPGNEQYPSFVKEMFFSGSMPMQVIPHNPDQ